MKYEHKCSNCGRADHYYAKGLCRACYDRLRRNGTFEKQYSRGIGSRPYRWSDKTKKILELHKSGMKQAEIVKEVGLTKQAVSIVIKNYAKPSNANRIRSMSDEELAKWLDLLVNQAKIYGENKVWLENTPRYYTDWLDWLKQEVQS